MTIRSSCLVVISFCTMSAYPAVINLGSADPFAVLAGTTVTNTGATIVDGNLGVWPGSSVTGFLPGIVNGTIDADDSIAMQAESDLTTAYNIAAGEACGAGNDLAGQDRGGLTLHARSLLIFLIGRAVNITDGRALPLNSALTMDTNQINIGSQWAFDSTL